MGKIRVYIALYARNGALGATQPAEPGQGEEEYHWALLVGPKHWSKEQESTRHRIKKGQEWTQTNPGKVALEKVEWAYEKAAVPLGRHDDIVVRVLLTNIEDAKAIEACVQRAWPEKTVRVKGQGGARTSREWVERAVEALRSPTLWKYDRLADWAAIESCCVSFAERVGVGGAKLGDVPTFDMVENRQVFD